MKADKIENSDVSSEAIPADYKGASAEAIQHHYDVGNEFYRLWLDNTLTYSCALWDEDETNDTLELAQLRKLDFHIRNARAQQAQHVLEIGSGWGSLPKRLVDVDGVEKVTTLTLSQAQLQWIESFQNSQIETRLENWFHHFPQQPYDSIILIEAFEAFVQRDLSEAERIETYRTFFQRCHDWLKPGGWMSLQTIAWGNMRREDLGEFIPSEIFPESDLPTLADIAKASERIFEVVELRNDRKHYERTHRNWLSMLKANRSAAVNLVGEETVARYEKYLKMSIVGFYTGKNDLLRLTLRRIDSPR
ncbi:MAG: cyclopropane-fatty-acyl-phospholipid synthase [Cyanobacteria bacterium SW_12_48_29]|nr:MAG: cyclopropane-fatty-acyl-phospholipid synthase [Cyanobacteria bacterium SW_12_48_29]PSP09945.1 MAG: cyclopropane-fatty-acyl-phospholipid synthase [Cyanobacteria bacterium SW_10_48_33]PSP26656.1 MAG: cyclopropane-fatty-acyl-phospholipid synthase [Cyanobacteria bacterium SW_8_48_13]